MHKLIAGGNNWYPQNNSLPLSFLARQPMEPNTEATITSEGIDKPVEHITDSVNGGRCGCGCVPNIKSLFEMAELRAKKRAADALKNKPLKEANN